jgi:hypothetical protein
VTALAADVRQLLPEVRVWDFVTDQFQGSPCNEDSGSAASHPFVQWNGPSTVAADQVLSLATQRGSTFGLTFTKPVPGKYGFTMVGAARDGYVVTVEVSAAREVDTTVEGPCIG